MTDRPESPPISPIAALSQQAEVGFAGPLTDRLTTRGGPKVLDYPRKAFTAQSEARFATYGCGDGLFFLPWELRCRDRHHIATPSGRTDSHRPDHRRLGSGNRTGRQYADTGLGTVDTSIIAAADQLEIGVIATLNRRDASLVQHKTVMAPPSNGP